MRRAFAAATAAIVGVSVARAVPLSAPEQLRARNIVDDVKDSYDFVVVGGGLAGLVLGGRLSEDSNHTVLVLEAGTTGDEFRERIDTPGFTYYQSLWPTPLNWAFQTVAQAGADNRQLVWPRGKVLGGSSAINGLYLNRPAEIEINAWKNMLGNMDGADNWTWESFFAALKKSESFVAPSDDIARQGGITFNAASHGTNGPVQNSYPGYTFDVVGQWGPTFENAGVQVTNDAYGGQNWGAYIATSAINPANWTRSTSKSGYLDPLPPRPNYDVLPGAFVTRVLFDSSSPSGNLTANAVEYTRDNGATKLTIKVNKEVILAGGTVGSPAVLMHSGVGPKDVLAAAGVPLLSELPGVGQHLQDHLSVSVQWSTDIPTAQAVYDAKGPESTNAAFLSFVNSATAYVNATTFFGAGVSDFQSGISGQVDQFVPKASADAGVISGYRAIYETTVNTILPSPVGQIELLLAINSANAVRITAALQHPFSHGAITINSSNPIDSPVIDPNYLAHPADYTILREGLKLARKLGGTDPLKGSVLIETLPGPTVQSDADWENWLRGQVGTEFHPSSTCAMLPREQGGVVDAQLRVYGLANVRVADASVPPIVFSAHLMSSTYGIAEQASSIIRSFYNGAPGRSGSSGSGSGDNGGSDGSGAAFSKHILSPSAVICALVALGLILL